MAATRAQGGFRPGDDLTGEPPPPPGAVFTPAADAGGTDRDVLTGYQLFLGRDPESSFVIADAKNSPIGAFLRALMGSGEFQSAVLDKLAAGRAVPHENFSAAPAPEQLDWLFRLVRVPPRAEAVLRAATSWAEWLRTLVAIPGLPTAPPRAADAAAGPASQNAGFVLINIEQPRPGDRIQPGALVQGNGWAIAPADIAEVAVHLDGKLLTHARYGLPRPDVARSFPHYRHVDHCGFSFSAEVPEDAQELAGQLTVTVRSTDGAAGQKGVRLQAPALSGSVLQASPGGPAVSGSAEAAWPIRLSVEEAVVDTERMLRLRGWAVSAEPMRAITATFGDTPLGEARHGLPRPDIASTHPNYANAGLSGFALVHQLEADAPAGPGFVRVQASDGAGHTRQTIVPVVIGPALDSAILPTPAMGSSGAGAALPPDGLPAGPRVAGEATVEGATDVDGGIEAGPVERAAIQGGATRVTLDTDGTLRVEGWAWAPDGIAGIGVELDGISLGQAELGRPSDEAAARFAGDAGAAQAGFAFGYILPRKPRRGVHRLSLHVQAANGQQRTLEAPLVAEPQAARKPAEAPAVPAAPAAAPPVAPARSAPPGMRLEVDRPSLTGEVARDPVRGALTIAGWAASRGGVDQVSVFCDERLLGHAHLGMRREDIGAAFPEYKGSLLAGYALVLPPGSLPEGVHRIRVVARATSDDAASPPAGTLERSFRLTVERYDALPPEGTIRIGVPPAETAFGLNLLRRHGYLPRFDVLIAGATESDLAALEATLRSLHGQAYRNWTATVPLADAAALAAVRGQAWAGDNTGRVRLAGPDDASPARAGTKVSGRKADAKAALASTAEPRQGRAREAGLVRSGPVKTGLAKAGATKAAAGKAARTGAGAPQALASQALASRAGASQPAAGIAQAGEAPAAPVFLMRLRAGDQLGADALLELACESAADRQADFIYADELRHDPGQARRQPFFKPDWSPELLLSMNYIGRPWCASAALAARAGLSAEALAAAPDYAGVLALTRHAAKIAHVPRVLCDRGPAGDTPAQEVAALSQALAQDGVAGQVDPGRVEGTWRIRRQIARRAPASARRPRNTVAGRISVIIPTCGAGGLVRTAIKTIRATSAPARPDGRDVEIVILDNTPVRETKLRAWLRRQADIVIDMPGAFNWSRFNNLGARAATGEYLLFLNDDIETRQPDWLEAMLEHVQRPEVGVVGARLLYPDGTVQHGGQYLADTHARHAFRFAPAASPGPFGQATVTREVISVTGACQMVRAGVFAQLGGFEEAHSVVNNDLDFCLRSWQAGLRVMFTPHATLTHHELASRAALQDSYDEQRFAGAWRTRFFAGDPYRSPRLALDADHYGADPEPAVLLHAGRRGPPADAVRRILAVKLDHIGDFLTALPAIRSLKRRFPAARIDLLAPAASAELARREPAISEVIVFDFFHVRSGQGQKGVGDAEFRELAARLAPAQYDIAIDLRMQPETRAVLPHTGAALLAGYDHGNRFPFLDVALEWEGDHRLVAKRAHVSERLIQLVSATEDACRAEATPDDAAPLEPSAVPALAALPPAFLARPIVCVHPGVGNVVRQWPVANYAALIDLLAAAGLHVVLVGAPEEASIAEDIIRRVSAAGAVESLVGRVKLAQLPAVMRACVLFVGNNSGPQHLAAALGMPAIGIHSGVVDAAEWAPLGSQAVAIRRRMICGPCYLEFASDCPRDLACLTGLKPRDVFAACRRMLPG